MATTVKGLSAFRLLAVTSLGFALTLTTNTLEPAVLSHKVLELVPAQRNTALGLTTFAGLLVAIVAQPIVGVFSDRTRSRWGRRLPYFVGGAALGAVCLYLIALAPAFSLVVLGVLLIQVASNTVQGPWQALIPDQVPEAQHGRAAGLKAMFDVLALVVGRQVAGLLVSRSAQWGQAAIVAAVSVPIVVYGLALIVTALWAREPPRSATLAPERSLKQALAGTFAIDWRAHPAFAWWFANRLLFWGAFVGLTTFLVFFMIDAAGLAEAEAQRYVGNISTWLGLALVAVTLPAGWLADRLGRKPVMVAAGLIAAGGTALVVFGHSVLHLITTGAVIVGLGIGLFLSSNWALVTDIVPAAEAARYLGLANIATAGGSALARFLGGALIDPLNHVLGSASAGYLVLYALAGASFLLSAVVVIPLKRKA